MTSVDCRSFAFARSFVRSFAFTFFLSLDFAFGFLFFALCSLRSFVRRRRCRRCRRCRHSTSSQTKCCCWSRRRRRRRRCWRRVVVGGGVVVSLLVVGCGRWRQPSESRTVPPTLVCVLVGVSSVRWLVGCCGSFLIVFLSIMNEWLSGLWLRLLEMSVTIAFLRLLFFRQRFLRR